MKIKHSILALSIGLLVLFSGGCSDELLQSAIRVSGVEVDPTSKIIGVAENHQLKATVMPEDADNRNVTWVSSNPEVAEVDLKGKITGKSLGTTTITVTTKDGGLTAECVITVEARAIPVEDIEISPTTLELEEGHVSAISASVTPINAGNLTVIWSSDNTGVATVDQDGLVTAVAEGTAVITATTADGGKTATCTVTVIEAIIRPKLAIEYFAEYNINVAGTGFATSHDIAQSGLFTWAHSNTNYGESANFQVGGKGYRMATNEEMRALTTEWHTGLSPRWSSSNTSTNFVEWLRIVGESTATEYKSDLRSMGNGIVYMIRFKGQGDMQRAAYRFQYSGDNQRVIIRVRWLGPRNTDVTMSQVTQEAWWDANTSEDIVRILPLTGFADATGTPVYIGERAYYWTGSLGGSANTPIRLEITTGLYNTGNSSTGAADGGLWRQPVRLVSID